MKVHMANTHTHQGKTAGECGCLPVMMMNGCVLWDQPDNKPLGTLKTLLFVMCPVTNVVLLFINAENQHHLPDVNV